MDRQSVILFGVLALAFLAAILAASLFDGTGSESGAQSELAPAPEKRLRAKKENVRKNARALTSTRKEEKPSGSGAAAVASDPVEVWGSLTHPKGKNSPKNEAERVAAEALTALDPEEGIETIQANLDALEGTEGSAELYAVLGTLYARLQPPDTAAMNEAFEAGHAAAPTEALRADIQFYHARALVAAGQHEAALAVLEASTEAGASGPGHRFESEVIRGMALEATGDKDGAVNAYSVAMEKAVADGVPPQGEQANTYRHAGLKLARIYRRAGKKAEADRVASELKHWLAR
jgi:predicted negative regulator of RcsB-dependent stress response